jgi:alpha-glucoside transport system ATP-binding protein
MSDVKLQAIKKNYGKVEVIKGVDLEIKKGEFIVFVGPSGCGKSTLLRTIAGLEEITAGQLYIDGAEVNDVPASNRGIAMVFQSYALYPHLSVYDNMAFALSIAKVKLSEIDKAVRSAADILQLTPYLERLPRDLSGGQRQRVAIGRAIVRQPKVFLFDEPLSNLDAALRVSTRIEIAKLKQSMPDTTMIYVTHDQVEAMTLADRIVVLSEGHIEQVGSPLELYNTPKNRFVAEFIGSPKMNLVSAKITNGMLNVEGSKGSLKVDCKEENVFFGIRPEHLVLCDEKDAILSGVLEVKEELGEYTLAHFKGNEGSALVAKPIISPSQKPGDMIHFNCDIKNIHLFDAKTELRL